MEFSTGAQGQRYRQMMADSETFAIIDKYEQKTYDT